jgi:hypothetical protein
MKVRITFDIELPQVKTELELRELAISYITHQHGSCDDDYTTLDLLLQCVNDVIDDGDLANHLLTLGHVLTLSNQFIQRVYP